MDVGKHTLVILVEYYNETGEGMAFGEIYDAICERMNWPWYRKLGWWVRHWWW